MTTNIIYFSDFQYSSLWWYPTLIALWFPVLITLVIFGIDQLDDFQELITILMALLIIIVIYGIDF